MPDLQIFIDRISTGQCILLTGAGFSRLATNFKNKNFLDGEGLANVVLEDLGVPSADRAGFDLRTATSKFMRDTDKDAGRLARLLSVYLTAKHATDDQQKITSQPWLRIYTTNFDDVHERALFDKTMSCDSFSQSGSYQPRHRDRQQIVHLHGYVNETNPTADPLRFVLGLESYADQRVTDSEWLARFRIDARSAPAIFIVGNSIQDTHLGDLFLTDQTIKDKTVVISGPSPSLAVQEYLSTYGEVLPIGVEGLAATLPKDPITIVAPTGAPESLKELAFFRADNRHDAPDVDALLMKGNHSVELINAQIVNAPSPPYFVERAKKVFEKIYNFKSKRIITIHSNAGNGKTIFAFELAARLKGAGFRIFEFRPEYFSGTAGPISYIEALSDNVAIIIEDFLAYRDFVNAVCSIGRTNILFIFTSRTNTWELRFPSIEAGFSGRYSEIDLNVTKPAEATLWAEYLISFGYWKDKAAWSPAQKLEFIGTKCKGEIRGILLALLDSPYFKAKLDGFFSKLNSLPRLDYELVILSTFLRYLNFTPNDSYFLSVLMNKDYLAQLPRIAPESDIYEVISRTGNISFKSSVFGEYFIRNHVPPDILVELLCVFAKRVDEKRFTQENYSELLRRMLRFSVIRSLVHERDGHRHVIDFFERNSALGIARYDPLYWVQYSIARMEDKRFDLCENYISQAYGIASNRKNYDTYQIDTHHARFLLQSRISGYKPDYFDAFERAHKYVAGVLTRREEDLVYPLQVSQIYLDFFHQFKNNLSEAEVMRIISASDFILNKITSYPTVLLDRNSVGKITVAKLNDLKSAARNYV